MITCKTENFKSDLGLNIALITITLNDGTNIQITNYGGIVHAWYCLDKDGHLADVLLGRKDILGYLDNHPYFGTITGRYANRIAFGKFVLNDQQYFVSTNLPPHHLHGGFSGLDKKIWDFTILEREKEAIITMTTQSPDLEEGFPGNLSLTVTYTFTDKNELTITYNAQTDHATPINLTNHCYFNLSGNQNEDILNHDVWINAKKITAVDETLIPTGELLNIEGSVLDFTTIKRIGNHIFSNDPLLKNAKGYDHNFVLEDHDFTQPIAIAVHPNSGLRLQVFTDQPAIQLYTGNHLDGTEGKSGFYKDYAGLCLETQHYPDSPNHTHFPNTILRPGILFHSKTMYKIDVMI